MSALCSGPASDEKLDLDSELDYFPELALRAPALSTGPGANLEMMDERPNKKRLKLLTGQPELITAPAEKMLPGGPGILKGTFGQISCFGGKIVIFRR